VGILRPSPLSVQIFSRAPRTTETLASNLLIINLTYYLINLLFNQQHYIIIFLI